MTQRTCPSCSRASEGRFCPECGTDMTAPATCASCSAELPQGGRFCVQCGAPADTGRMAAASAANQPASSPRRTSWIPWAIAAGAMAAVLGMLLYPRAERDADPLATAAGPPITGTAAQGVDLSSMTPREAADRLFNRVMQYVSDGDTAQARQFLPMALAAYERVGELDRDGHYHVAVLELVNDRPQVARAHADTILAEEPNHLFGLATAAQAESAMGNRGESEALYRRLLEVYDVEAARPLPEYSEHRAVIPAVRAEAVEAVGGVRTP